MMQPHHQTSHTAAILLANPVDRRQPPDESVALAAWSADPEIRAQVTRDNEARASVLARREARARSDEDLFRRHYKCSYWTVTRNFSNDDTEAVFQAGNRRELDALEQEIRRRPALQSPIRQSVGYPAIESTKGSLSDLAQRAKQVLSVPDVLMELNVEPKRTGSSRGREEWHSSCPFCGGDDRFISWGHPDSNWFCRECREGGDIVTLAEKVLKVSAAEAIRRLVRLAQVPV